MDDEKYVDGRILYEAIKKHSSWMFQRWDQLAEDEQEHWDKIALEFENRMVEHLRNNNG